MTLNELLDFYIENHDYGMKPSSVITWRSIVSRFEETLGVTANVEQLNDESVNRHLDRLASKEYAAATISTHRTILLCLWQAAWRERILDELPRKIRRVRNKKKINRARFRPKIFASYSRPRNHSMARRGKHTSQSAYGGRRSLRPLTTPRSVWGMCCRYDTTILSKARVANPWLFSRRPATRLSFGSAKARWHCWMNVIYGLLTRRLRCRGAAIARDFTNILIGCGSWLACMARRR